MYENSWKALRTSWRNAASFRKANISPILDLEDLPITVP
jgi:hypothetical protein